MITAFFDKLRAYTSSSGSPPPLSTDSGAIAELQDYLEKLDAAGRLAWASRQFGNRAAIGTSFQGAGIVAMHLVKQAKLRIPVFTLDTGLHFIETIELKAELQEHLGITIENITPAFTLEQQASEFGPELWKHDPDLCCQIRKVLPLQEKLTSLDCWITGVRREQSDNRSSARVLELNEDENGRQLWKLNPLVDWTRNQIWEHIRQHNLPYNRLHDQGYRSIGCHTCTRAVADGTNERAGRWTGFNKTECGIHTFLKVKN
ncbi:MAG: phosphoadenylyl-sulfate reductase [Puniceicoccales bacterium]|jgi:phosphoadenosine phosphosulfate reductase|nr:phosphoadenylyl-sulfate reductase [Puniceicoccales bacterium]